MQQRIRDPFEVWSMTKYFPNSRIKKMEIDGLSRLCLFAIKNIIPVEQIRYFYGDNNLPWHADVSFYD